MIIIKEFDFIRARDLNNTYLIIGFDNHQSPYILRANPFETKESYFELIPIGLSPRPPKYTFTRKLHTASPLKLDEKINTMEKAVLYCTDNLGFELRAFHPSSWEKALEWLIARKKELEAEQSMIDFD